MANPYGITLTRAWTEWAAEQGMSEKVAAALYLIATHCKTDGVVAKLKPSEVELVVDKPSSDGLTAFRGEPSPPSTRADQLLR
jgi:hypothetical protein